MLFPLLLDGGGADYCWEGGLEEVLHGGGEVEDHRKGVFQGADCSQEQKD